MNRPFIITLKTALFLGFIFLMGTETYALCVNVEKANLRYGPSTKYRKTWEVYRYMPFQELKRQKDWYRVKDVDGDIHWVNAPLVTKAFQCAVVKDPTANLRSGPGTNYDIVKWGPAEKYYAFKVLKKKGQWIYVQDAADGKAWIYAPLVWIQ